MKPTVLVAATRRWFSTARLVMALAEAGFVVEVVCPDEHPIAKTGSFRQMYPYHGLMPVKSFTRAIAAAKPDLVVPSDELASRHLHDLYHQLHRSGRTPEVLNLIVRSLGDPGGFDDINSRTQLMHVAEEEKVRVPLTQIISEVGDLKRWTSKAGLPTVLKTDGSSGGTGVSVVRTFEEAKSAFANLQAPPSLAKAVRQFHGERDATLFLPALLRSRPVVNAQTFVPGRQATSTIACWKGTVLAGLHFEVLKTAYAGGPSTVVKWIENVEMTETAKTIARRLKLSGIHGLDFILEHDTGDAYLIELNPRSTQVGHLTLGPGRDLPAALFAAISGEEIRIAPVLTNNPVIAFFPQEWTRDSSSEFLRSAYHDVPWDKPELIRLCIAAHRNHSGWRPAQPNVVAYSPARSRT